MTAGFHKFVNNCGLELHGDLSEVYIYSEKYRYAGAMDAIGWRQKPDGTRAFVALDWKTSKATRSEYALQLAAYARAFARWNYRGLMETLSSGRFHPFGSGRAETSRGPSGSPAAARCRSRPSRASTS